MSLRLASISDIEPSDSMLYRCWQMVCELVHSVIESVFNKITPLIITTKNLEEKLDYCEEFFESKDVEPINHITPRELYLLRREKSFVKLRDSRALQIARERITNAIPDGVSIFVTSRLTGRLIKDKRFDIADVFRYIGGRDLKHMGFVVKNKDELTISHVDPENNGLKKVEDPLIFAHSMILGFNFSSVKDRKRVQDVFNQTLLTEALKPRRNIPSMGPWVVLPFFLGHKRYWSPPSNNIALKEGQREMCSSYVTKILLKSFEKAKIPNPIPQNEIIERIDIIRFFLFFREFLVEIPMPEQILKAFPSPPTLKIRRFLKLS